MGTASGVASGGLGLVGWTDGSGRLLEREEALGIMLSAGDVGLQPDDWYRLGEQEKADIAAYIKEVRGRRAREEVEAQVAAMLPDLSFAVAAADLEDARGLTDEAVEAIRAVYDGAREYLLDHLDEDPGPSSPEDELYERQEYLDALRARTEVPAVTPSLGIPPAVHAPSARAYVDDPYDPYDLVYVDDPYNPDDLVEGGGGYGAL